ncbi:TPM domain-containing protein [Paraburkholderia diazotrophica]|uniref:TPM domain-containing protein n=1 Tax=Paraburkholderia diazotrophica TaxID=667676 RepID=UPI0015A5FF0E|nr:TPM domain-containing protein [Paraburkholderia diazotrophica]
MDLKRIVRHLMMTHWRVKVAFPQRTLSVIEIAIHESHKAHVGQVRFVVEGALHSAALFDGLTARERAIDAFSQLRVWDTEDNNGVLIYLLLADRDVEIVADRGIHSRVSGDEWEAVCRMMELEFQCAKYESGAVRGIEQVTALLKKHFPAHRPPREELPSSPIVM